MVSTEAQEDRLDGFPPDDEENCSPQPEEQENPGVVNRDFSQNRVSLTFSWTLMNQVRQMAKMEGICAEDLLVELVAEGLARRTFEDQSRPAPSHLMTRTGYVHHDENQGVPQPRLSHHMPPTAGNYSPQANGNQQNRSRGQFQQRGHVQNQKRNGNGKPYQGNRGANGQQPSGNRNQYYFDQQQPRPARQNQQPNSRHSYGDGAGLDDENGQDLRLHGKGYQKR